MTATPTGPLPGAQDGPQNGPQAGPQAGPPGGPHTAPPTSTPFELDAGPDAPAVAVLCHGFTGAPDSMLPWGEYLHAHGITAYGPLLPGHGGHWTDLRRVTELDWYRALDDVFERALGHGKPVFVMGLSMGGALVLRLAELRGDQVAGIAVANPSLTTESRAIKYLVPLIHRFGLSAKGIGGDIAKPDTREPGYARIPLSGVRALSRLWKVTAADLGRIRQPLRVFRSAVDHVVEPSSARLLLARVSSTDVAEVVLPRSYHVATLDYDAEMIFAGSLELIRSVLAAPTPATTPASATPAATDASAASGAVRESA